MGLKVSISAAILNVFVVNLSEVWSGNKTNHSTTSLFDERAATDLSPRRRVVSRCPLLAPSPVGHTLNPRH